MKITHVNHASLLIEDNGEFVLTDPWYLSPAIGNWTQYPFPAVDTIRTILSIPKDKLKVVISHGHDDHLDEFFIAKHLSQHQIFVPKFRTNGLPKRIERLTGVYPIEISAESLSAGEFEFAAQINEDFTNYDSIVLIGSKTCGIIHANDNWHAYPDRLIQEIQAFNAKRDNIFFFTQFGIADCFPVNYPSYSKEEALEIVQKRFAGYTKAISSNMARLNLSCAYTYANQSTYRYPEPFTGMSMYDMAQEYIASREQFKQLMPMAEVTLDGLKYAEEVQCDLFTFCLKALEKMVQTALREPVRLLLPNEATDSDTIALQADPLIWQRILIGDITLEAITIGGMGTMIKPKEVNITEIHRKISKLAYLIQNSIRDRGISYFDV
jgi:hypothetical protein